MNRGIYIIVPVLFWACISSGAAKKAPAVLQKTGKVTTTFYTLQPRDQVHLRTSSIEPLRFGSNADTGNIKVGNKQVSLGVKSNGAVHFFGIDMDDNGISPAAPDAIRSTGLQGQRAGLRLSVFQCQCAV